MALPKAVQKQINEANKIVEEMKNPPKEEPKEEKVEAVPEEPVQEEPVQEETATQAAEPPKEEKPQEEKDYEQMYKVLQGKYNAEVPRLTNQVRSLKQELDDFRESMESFKKKNSSAKEAQTKAESLISPEEIEDYGPDFIDLVGRKAQEVARTMTANLQGEIRQLKEQLNGVSNQVQQSGQERFFSELDKKVENWRELNEDQRFLDWLSESDVYAGTERGALLREAYSRGDVNRVAAFFNGFLRENAAVSEDASGRPQRDTSKVPMDKLVSPGKPRGGASEGARNQKRIWTEAEVNRVMADIAAGRYKKDPETKERLYHEVHEAAMEGRIRGPEVPFANSGY